MCSTNLLGLVKLLSLVVIEQNKKMVIDFSLRQIFFHRYIMISHFLLIQIRKILGQTYEKLAKFVITSFK